MLGPARAGIHPQLTTTPSSHTDATAESSLSVSRNRYSLRISTVSGWRPGGCQQQGCWARRASNRGWGAIGEQAVAAGPNWRSLECREIATTIGPSSVSSVCLSSPDPIPDKPTLQPRMIAKMPASNGRAPRAVTHGIFARSAAGSLQQASPQRCCPLGTRRES